LITWRHLRQQGCSFDQKVFGFSFSGRVRTNPSDASSGASSMFGGSRQTQKNAIGPRFKERIVTQWRLSN
jgi:hypothetical protein